ncbi:MAG: universal stress protein [Desulfobacteraceae bacterium]
MFKKILLAYDGSEGAKRALALGIDLARMHQAKLCALAVWERLPRFSGTIDEVKEEKEFADRQYGEILSDAQVQAQESGLEMQTILRLGHPAQTIVQVATEGQYDLILMGHSGLSGVWAKFLGTTAEKVSRHAPCSVLIVR